MYGRTNASSKKLVLSSTISSAVDTSNTKRFKITVTVKDQDNTTLLTSTGYTNTITSTVTSAVDSSNTKRYKISETVKDSGNTTMLTSTAYTAETTYNNGDSAGYARGRNDRQSDVDYYYNQYVSWYNSYNSILSSYNSMVSERDTWRQRAYDYYNNAVTYYNEDRRVWSYYRSASRAAGYGDPGGFSNPAPTRYY